MKLQTINNEIVAMRAEVNKLKGQLSLSKTVEQAIPKAGDVPPKSDEGTGGSTNKQRQKQDKAWKKVPPAAGEPTTKKIRNKDFNWCIHHMAWTVHRPQDCTIGLAAATAVRLPPGTTANAATFSTASIVDMLGNSLGLTAESDY